MSDRKFKMSKYVNKEALYEDMAKHYKEKCYALEEEVRKLKEEIEISNYPEGLDL